MERKNGLGIGIINTGTFLQKEEEVVEMMEKRSIEVLGISETRDKITGRESYTTTKFTSEAVKMTESMESA